MPANKMAEPMKMEEPELPEIPDTDKPLVRNVLYTIWALNVNDAPCVGWQVQTCIPFHIVGLCTL